MFNNLFKNKKQITVGIQLCEENISLLLIKYNDNNNDNYNIIDYVNYKINNYIPIQNLNDYIVQKKIKNSNSCLVLDDNDYQLLVIEPPNVDRDEMISAMKWKIKDLIQYPIKDVVIDIFLHKESDSLFKEIAYVVVVNKDIISNRKKIIEKIGLNLLSIDIPEFSYRNYFEKIGYLDKCRALVLVKKNYGKLIILYKSYVYFSRSFKIQYNGGLLDPIPEYQIVLEIQRSLDYYERQIKKIMPSTLVIIGDNITENKITKITTDNFSQDIFIGTINDFNLSEEDSLSIYRVMVPYGASLRKDLI